jgi:hypothetical protein
MISALSRYHVAIVLLIVACVTSSSNAASLFTYDLDSLVFESTEIMQATVIDQQSSGPYTKSSTVKVDQALFGKLKQGDTVTLPYLDGYRVGANWPSKTRGIGKGDEVFLFLAPPSGLYKTLSPDKDKSKLLVISSGVKLIDAGKVIGFRQFSNPGPYQTEQRGGNEPTAADYRKQIDQSIAYVRPMVGRLTQPAKAADASWFLQLIEKRSKRPAGWNDRDLITETACIRLAETHDFTALDAAIHVPNTRFGMESLYRGFASPQGQAYLIAKLSAPITPASKPARAPYASALSASPFLLAGNASADHDIDKEAQLAIDSDQHGDPVTAAILLRHLQQLANSYQQLKQNNSTISEKVTTDLIAALTTLRNAFDHVTQESRYGIDCAFLEAPANLGFVSHCGPVASMLRSSTPELHFAPARAGEITCLYDYVAQNARPRRSFGAEVVFEEVKTGKQIVEPFSFTAQSGSSGGGSGATPIPPHLPAGKYRVFLRITENAKPIGDGYGEIRDLPGPR